MTSTDRSESPIGVLFVNLGTPDEPTTKAVRRYLREFLSDPRVVPLPRLPWKLLLEGVILRVRPAKSAALYRKVWTEEGSPLLTLTGKLACKTIGRLMETTRTPIVGQVAMRYGNPSIRRAVRELSSQGVRRVVVLPLFPQYCDATTGSVHAAVARAFEELPHVPSWRMVMDYCDHPAYVEALRASLEKERAQPGERLLLSFHGIPESLREKGDPYFDHCVRTRDALSAALGSPEPIEMAFQSRFGRAKWLEPATDHTLEAWGREGLKRVRVICPGFSVDCLETLEEIAITGNEQFQEAGGERLTYVPALNDSPEHARALATIVSDELRGWIQEAS